MGPIGVRISGVPLYTYNVIVHKSLREGSCRLRGVVPVQYTCFYGVYHTLHGAMLALKLPTAQQLGVAPGNVMELKD